MNFESVHNYYEHLVFDEILAKAQAYQLPNEPGILEDIACVALNRLPPRYIRYEIDFAFYMTTEERANLEISVREAVRSAVDYVLARNRARKESASPV